MFLCVPGAALTDQPPLDLEPASPTTSKTVWQENHGSWLLFFFGLVFAAGSLILLYRQNRFVPVRFPNSQSITTPGMLDETAIEELGDVMYLLVSGSENDQGMIRLAFYETPESFNDPEKAFLRITQPIEGGIAKVVIPYQLVPERFAVAAFHDMNADGVLDRNAIGLPSERYGFSEDARALTGPPSYAAATTNRPPIGGTIGISIR